MKHRFCSILLNCYHLSDMRHMWTINRRLMTHWEPLITGDTLYTRERERNYLELGWFYNSYSASDTCYIYSVISGGCQWPHDNVVTSSWHRVTARMWPDFLIIKTIWCLSLLSLIRVMCCSAYTGRVMLACLWTNNRQPEHMAGWFLWWE